MRNIFVYLFLSIISFQTYGQSNKIQLVNNVKEPVSYANIVFLTQENGLFIAGTVSDNQGIFLIPDTLLNKKNDVIMKISSIGYVSFETNLSEVNSNQLILEEDSKALDEVVIKASKQPFKMKQGVLVAEVQGSLLSQLGTANDLLDKIPFVTKSASGFTVFGKGAPLIYINNRKVRNNSELALLSSKDIKDISVITSPGAEYDARVSSIIKITTLRPLGEGYSNNVYTSFENGSNFQGFFSNSMNYRIKSFDFFSTLAYSRENKDIASNQEYTFHHENENITQISNQRQHIKGNYIFPNGGINFTPNPKHSMGTSYRGVFANTKLPSFLGVLTNTNGIVLEKQEEYIFNKNENHQHILNGYYNYQDDNIFKFYLTIDGIEGGQDLLQNAISDTNIEKVNTKSHSSFKLFAGKVNFEYNSQYGTIKLGAEYTRTNFKQSYKIVQTNIGLNDNSNETQQNRFALFSAYNIKYKRLGIDVGARYEQVDGKYYSDRKLQKEQSPKYHHFFPSTTLSYDATEWQLALSYNSKITYPTYTQLRNFANYVSPVVYESGNPNLKPTIRHSSQLLFVKKKLRLMSSYGVNKHSIYPIMYVMKDQPIIMKIYENLKNTHYINTVASYSFKLDFWQPTAEMGMNKQWLNMTGNKYNHIRWSYRFLNSIILPDKYILRVDFTGYSKGQSQLAYYNNPSYLVNLRLSKSFPNLDINLSANDIFQSTKQSWTVLYDSIKWSEDKYYNYRNITLSISYRINATNRRYKGRTDNDELNRLY